MQRKWIAFVLGTALVVPGVMAQRRGGNQGGQGNGAQLRQRIHQPGTGLQTGTATRARQRKRDGTGLNCPNGPCLQNRTRTQTQTQTETQTNSRTQQEKPTPPPKN